MNAQSLQPREQLSEGQRLAGLGYGRANSLSRKELDGAALQQKHQAKDFSRDPQRLDWADPSSGQFSRAALLAQGHQLPPLPRPRVQPYPKHVSLIQDPQFMEHQADSQAQRRSLRELRPSRIDSQRMVENQFQKPTGGRSPKELAHLYFQAGEGRAPARRVGPNKNYSSQERVYGLDYAQDLASADQARGQEPGAPGQAGKRQFNGRTNSTRNLLTGHYGHEQEGQRASMNKPYSKQHPALDNASLFADGQNLPIEQKFKQMHHMQQS